MAVLLPSGYGRHYLYRYIRQDKNEPFYIGIGTKQKRHTFSYSRARAKHFGNKILSNIINKVSYEVEILVESNEYETVKEREIEFIKLYGRIDKETGTLANMTDGGDGVVGFACSEERKAKIGKANKGKSRYGQDNGFYGKTHSEQSRRQMSERRKGGKDYRKNIENVCKKILDVDNNVIYNSVTELSRTIDVNKHKIYDRFRIKKKGPGKGTRPEYIIIKGITYKYV